MSPPKNNYLTLRSKSHEGHYGTRHTALCHTPTYQISFTYLERQKGYGPDKLRWEEVEANIRLKQYVSLRSKRRHNKDTYFLVKNQQKTEEIHKLPIPIKADNRLVVTTTMVNYTWSLFKYLIQNDLFNSLSVSDGCQYWPLTSDYLGNISWQ